MGVGARGPGPQPLPIVWRRAAACRRCSHPGLRTLIVWSQMAPLTDLLTCCCCCCAAAACATC